MDDLHPSLEFHVDALPSKVNSRRSLLVKEKCVVCGLGMSVVAVSFCTSTKTNLRK